jgi:hypothetical protein
MPRNRAKCPPTALGGGREGNRGEEGEQNIEHESSELGPRNPSSCIGGLALQCVLVGLMPRELDSRLLLWAPRRGAPKRTRVRPSRMQFATGIHNPASRDTRKGLVMWHGRAIGSVLISSTTGPDGRARLVSRPFAKGSADTAVLGTPPACTFESRAVAFRKRFVG